MLKSRITAKAASQGEVAGKKTSANYFRLSATTFLELSTLYFDYMPKVKQNKFGSKFHS